jgi:UDP-galactopyranose mutase
MPTMTKFDYLVVGAGFAGSVCARQLADGGKRVLVIEQRDHVGGNAYDEVNEDGILVHKYGAHIFHTNSPRVFEYLSRFTRWRSYDHCVLSSVGTKLVPMPINLTTLDAFDGDEAGARAALIEPYTRKQWGPYADRLAPSVLARIATRDNRDHRYFTDAYQVMPLHGYTHLFRRLLDHPNILVKTQTRFEPIMCADFPRLIWSGPIDQFFGYCYGRLPYRSATFSWKTFNFDRFQQVGVVNYPDERVPYTRIIEFKHLTGQRHQRTTIAIEQPSAEGEPFWPVPTAETARVAAQYKALAAETPQVSFLGRLGSYQYFDMHHVVAQALTLSARLLRGVSDANAVA